MTPDDLRTVEGSWAQLRRRRPALLEGLTRRFDGCATSSMAPDARAAWLLAAVEELVGLLVAPSQLGERARALGRRWPDPLTAPSYAVDGRAWMGAAGACQPGWTEHTEAAWRQAWLLLSDVLAAEALAPFTTPR